MLLALGVTLAVELFNQKVFTQGGTGLWDFLTGAPLAFAVDMLLVLVTLVPALFLRRQAFWCTLLSAVWLSLGAVNGFILVNRQTPLYCGGPHSAQQRAGHVAQLPFKGSDCAAGSGHALVLAGLMLLFWRGPRWGGAWRTAAGRD